MNRHPGFFDHGGPPGPFSSGPFPLARRERWNEPRRIEQQLALAFAFLTPMNFLRPDAFYFTAADMFACATLFAMLLNGSLRISPLGAGTMFWNLGVGLMTGMLLASSLVHGDPLRGFILVAQYLFAYFLVPLVVLSRPWREIVSLMKAFCLSVGFLCLHGIYVIHVVGETNTRFVSGSGRLLGFVERENECATLIALAVPLLLFLATTRRLKRRWLILGVPLYAYGIMLTGSNTGLLALSYAIGAFVVAACAWRTIVLTAGGAVLAFTAILAWGRDFLPAVFQKRVLGALETGNIDEAGTFEGRVQLIHEALHFSERAFGLGIGADQYREVSFFHAPVHNTYLLLWVEGGLGAMIGFVVLMIGALLTAAVAFTRPGGRIAGTCTLVGATLFLLLANALPHLYGRFFVVPVILAVAPSVLLLGERRRTPLLRDSVPPAVRRPATP